MKYWGTTIFYLAIVWLTYLDFGWLLFAIALALDALVSRVVAQHEKTTAELRRRLDLTADHMWRKSLLVTERYMDYAEDFEMAKALDNRKEMVRLKEEFVGFKRKNHLTGVPMLHIENMPVDLARRMTDLETGD